MKTITAKQLAALRESGHVVAVYPRKGIAVVDGFKRYKLA